ncbi:hypothetical protein OH76DRAFT_1348391, partial [Lentinus brumalis]
VGWGNEALQYQFYKGLPSRLKDRISEIGKPKDLHKLRELAQSIDARYWERRTEQNRETRTSTSGSKSPPTPNLLTPSKPATPKTPAKTAKPYADKLGKDGKLTPEERQRRFAANLCLFCGGPGHTADVCPTRTAAQVRAAQAQTLGAHAHPDNAPGTAEPKN